MSLQQIRTNVEADYGIEHTSTIKPIAGRVGC